MKLTKRSIIKAQTEYAIQHGVPKETAERMSSGLGRKLGVVSAFSVIVNGIPDIMLKESYSGMPHRIYMSAGVSGTIKTADVKEVIKVLGIKLECPGKLSAVMAEHRSRMKVYRLAQSFVRRVTKQLGGPTDIFEVTGTVSNNGTMPLILIHLVEANVGASVWQAFGQYSISYKDDAFHVWYAAAHSRGCDETVAEKVGPIKDAVKCISRHIENRILRVREDLHMLETAYERFSDLPVGVKEL